MKLKENLKWTHNANKISIQRNVQNGKGIES